MKRIIQLVILALMSHGLTAQTAFTVENFPYAGLEIEYVEVNIGGVTDSFEFGKGGWDNQFDFSALTEVLIDTNTATETFSISYFSPDDVLLPGKPVNANVATFEFETDTVSNDTILEFYNFFQSGSGVFVDLGFIGVVDLSAAFGGPVTGNLDTIPFLNTNTDTIISTQFEMGYMTTVTQAVRGELNDSMTLAQGNVWDIHVDANGSLSSHLATYDSVYRVKKWGEDFDSTLINGVLADLDIDTNAVYEYYAHGFGHPVIKCSMSSDFASMHRVEYLSSSNWQSTISSHPEIQKLPELRMYPNPGTGLLNIRHTTNTHAGNTFVVYNHIGQELGKYETSSIDQLTSIDLGHLNSGSYLIILEDDNGIIKAVETYVKTTGAAR